MGGEYLPSSRINKVGLRSKVNLILRNKAVNEETESEPSRVVRKEGWAKEGTKRREREDRGEEAKEDEKRDKVGRRCRRKRMGVGAKND